MREVARSRNLLSGFVTTLKRLFESVVGTLFCLLLYMSRNNTFKSRNSIRDGKSLEYYKGHSPLASGACQAPHFTYSQHIYISAASTNSTRCAPRTTHIYSTLDRHPAYLLHRCPQRPHIDRSRGVFVPNNLQWRPTPHSPIRLTQGSPPHLPNLLLYLQAYMNITDY